MKKQAIQFEEGDVLLYDNHHALEVRGGRWAWVPENNAVAEPTLAEQAILDKLTEIVKPLRTHKIGDTTYREDGYCRSTAYPDWGKVAGLEAHRDLFTSWGWPIPAHMEEK